jgi:anti-sigma B factor antagonist
MTKALTIRARREPGCVVVTVAGEIDIATVARLRARLSALAVGGVPLVADLDQVSFIDATGLGALAGAARDAAAQGTSMYVVCSRAQTRRLFRVTGLDRQVPLARDLAEVLVALEVGRGTAPS